MTPTFTLAAIAVAGLVVSLALIPLRTGGANAGRLKPVGGGWWILSIVTIGLWGMSVATALKANAKTETAEALQELKVLSAAELLKAPDDWMNVPVVITDVAYCAEKMPEAGNDEVLAVRTKMKGEDEIEGEENDYIDTVDYGQEQDAVKFNLGEPFSKLRVDGEGLTILPAGQAMVKEIDTGEFSAAKGGNLMDQEIRQTIACGATVSVSGIVTKDGEFVVLDNLPKAISILTDRPWPDVVKFAQDSAKDETRGGWVWFILAAIFGLSQLAGTVMARRKA